MSEHLPNPEGKKLDDEGMINRALEEAAQNVENISPAAARMIADKLHGGQWTALYSFLSTGTVDYEGMSRELDQYLRDDKHELSTWAAWLHSYALDHQADTSPVEGWSKLWLYDESGISTSAWTEDGDWPEGQRPLSAVDRAQKLYDQDADYKQFIQEFTREELVELWSVCGDGMTYSFDDEVYDALASEYNHFEVQEAPVGRLAAVSEDELKEHITNPITPEEAGQELTRRLGERGLMWQRYLSEDGERIDIFRKEDES